MKNNLKRFTWHDKDDFASLLVETADTKKFNVLMRRVKFISVCINPKLAMQGWCEGIEKLPCLTIFTLYIFRMF